MKITAFFSFALIALLSCTDGSVEPACSTPATVRDLTGLDGCGWVFELEDGTQLQPYWIMRCGTPPVAREMEDSPIYDFEFVDGKTVFIDYELKTDVFNACMAGPVAEIICISDRFVDTGEE